MAVGMCGCQGPSIAIVSRMTAGVLKAAKRRGTRGLKEPQRRVLIDYVGREGPVVIQQRLAWLCVSAIHTVSYPSCKWCPLSPNPYLM